MIYRILNTTIEKKIERLRIIENNFLSNDNSELNKDGSTKRLNVDRKYHLLVSHFKKDQKRRYMTNRNYLKYLEAVIYLYRTSSASVQSGILMAPTEIYGIIDLVQKSFDEAVLSLNLK